jgi:hypothetical protein
MHIVVYLVTYIMNHAWYITQTDSPYPICVYQGSVYCSKDTLSMYPCRFPGSLHWLVHGTPLMELKDWAPFVELQDGTPLIKLPGKWNMKHHSCNCKTEHDSWNGKTEYQLRYTFYESARQNTIHCSCTVEHHSWDWTNITLFLKMLINIIQVTVRQYIIQRTARWNHLWIGWSINYEVNWTPSSVFV